MVIQEMTISRESAAIRQPPDLLVVSQLEASLPAWRPGLLTRLEEMVPRVQAITKEGIHQDKVSKNLVCKNRSIFTKQRVHLISALKLTSVVGLDHIDHT